MSTEAVEPQEEPTEVEEPTTPAEGVFVFVKTRDDGGIQVGFDLIGEISPLATPILLELAARAARLHVGLGNG